MRIYVASSWRNDSQAEVVKALREDGHEVYDFKEPKPGEPGFSWASVDPKWRSWTPEEYVEGLKHEEAVWGFQRDMVALRNCDACVLVLPCGRSAHTEMGYAEAKDKVTVVILDENSEPELMYAMFDKITADLDEARKYLKSVQILEFVPN